MKLFTYLLLFSIMLQTGSKQLIYSEYLINKDFIASSLCINKDFPEKKCEGKCHLKKQLAKDSSQKEGDQKNPKPAIDNLYLSSSDHIAHYLVRTQAIYFDYAVNSVPGFSSSVDHPPSGMVL